MSGGHANYEPSDYIGQVVNTKQGEDGASLRVQVRIKGLWDAISDSDLPWASLKLPIGAGANRGDYSPLQSGDYVWVDFPFSAHGRKDRRQPRITGSVHVAPNEVPLLPHEAFKGSEAYQHQRSGDEPTAKQADYATSKVLTYNGSTIEMAEGGVLRLYTRATGAILELNGEGKVLVKGASDITITTPADLKIRANNIDIKASGTVDMQSGGNTTIKAPMIDLNP